MSVERRFNCSVKARISANTTRGAESRLIQGPDSICNQDNVSF